MIMLRIIWNKHTQTAASFLVFFLLWELAVIALEIRSYILPAPSEIFQALLKYHAELLSALLFTVRSLLIGCLLAVAAGILLALPIAYSTFMQRSVYPLILFFQVIPKVALAPIFVIWFGFGLPPKIMIVFLLSFFPVVINTVEGLERVLIPWHVSQHAEH